MIIDAPPAHYVTSLSSIQMQLASNPNLNDVKRGIMIDRLIANDNEPDIVKKMLQLYEKTDSIEIKNKIAQDLMFYDQRHQNNIDYLNQDQLLLKAFFTQLLNSEKLDSKLIDDAIRGYIDTHSPEEIILNKNKIDKLLLKTDHYASIMLKYSLVHKSKELQIIYMKSIVKELRQENNSDLDSYLFGPLSIGYQNSGKNLLESESKKLVIDYLIEVEHKYSEYGIKANSSDRHRISTAPYYFELKKAMGLE